MHKEPRIFDALLIVTFIIGLFLPLLLTHNRDMSPIEKRKLATFPELKYERTIFATFPSQFEAFFNDHFGFRDQLVQLYSVFNVMLKSSSSPHVLIGKDDWLFYINPAEGNSLEDYRGNDPLTPEGLMQWKAVLETKHAWLKQQGIQYLFIIAPDKHSIYREYFPSRFLNAGKRSRLDQLLEYMHDSDVPILDLRPALIHAKSQGLLYYKTDSHWNYFGAAVAQNAIMQRLAKFDPTLHSINYRIEDFSSFQYSGDLAQMLHLSSRVKEMSPLFRKPLPLCNKQMLEEGKDNSKKEHFLADCKVGAPRLLLFGDSFFWQLQQYIVHYFSKSLYVPIARIPTFDQSEQYVNLHAPHIVIEELVERSLKFIPALPTSQNQAYNVFLERRFQTGIIVYQLADYHYDELVDRHQLTITPAEQSYKLLAYGNDPHFCLPEFKTDKTLQYIMKMELNAPQAASWQIFYRTLPQPQYREEHSISVQLQPGENTFYVAFDGQNLQGQIKIDPGAIPGEYLLKSLEIRAVKRQ